MKNVIITGGAGGIGSHIVERFAQDDFHIYIIDTDAQGAAELVEKIGSEKCTYWNADVADIESIKSACLVDEDKFVVDSIITLAGRALENEWLPFQEQNFSEISKSIDLNLLGHINIVRYFLPYMKEQTNNNSIVMVSSINCYGGFGLPVYSAAKAGLYGFAKALASEVGKKKIRINILSLGTVVTEATKKEPKDFEQLLKGTALGRFATAREAAEVTYNMCVNFRTMTGQEFILDAGQTVVR